jgi:hypothetical protein
MQGKCMPIVFSTVLAEPAHGSALATRPKANYNIYL